MTGQTPPRQRLHRGDRVRVIIDDATVNYDDDHLDQVEISYRSALGACEVVITPDSAAVTIERLGQDFGHNEVWKDRGGLLWVAQTNPDCHSDEDPTEVRLYSALGDIPLERAEQYGPWTRVYPAAAAGPEPWTDAYGRVWDLTARYVDPNGIVWHYAGEFGPATSSLSSVPLMSCDDTSVGKVRITAVIANYGPLAVATKGGRGR